VVYLPTYHHYYNPVELILAQVKGSMAKKNTTLMVTAFGKATLDTINCVTI
jgi:transposase